MNATELAQFFAGNLPALVRISQQAVLTSVRVNRAERAEARARLFASLPVEAGSQDRALPVSEGC